MKNAVFIICLPVLMICLIMGTAWSQIQPPQASYTGFVQSTIDSTTDEVTLTLISAKVSSLQYSSGTLVTMNSPEESVIGIMGSVLFKGVTVAGALCDNNAASVTFNAGAKIEINDTAMPTPHKYITADYIVGGNIAAPGLTVYKTTTGWAFHPEGTALDPNEMSTLNLYVGATSTTTANPSRFIDEYESALESDRIAGMTAILTPFPGATLCGGGFFNLNGIIDGVFTPQPCSIGITKTVTPNIVQCPCDNEAVHGDSDSDSDGDGDTDSGDLDDNSDSDTDPLIDGNCVCQGVVSDFSDSDSDSDGDGDTDSGDCDYDSDSDTHYDSDDSSRYGGYDSDDGGYDSDSDSDGTCHLVCPPNQEVTYTYVITNTGADLVNVHAIDDKLGVIASFSTFAAGETQTITKTKCIFEDITNTVRVKGFLESSCDEYGHCTEHCIGEASETVTVEFVIGDHTFLDSDSDSDSEAPGDDSDDSGYWWWHGRSWW